MRVYYHASKSRHKMSTVEFERLWYASTVAFLREIQRGKTQEQCAVQVNDLVDHVHGKARQFSDDALNKLADIVTDMILKKAKKEDT